jgi:hypothetical protein
MNNNKNIFKIYGTSEIYQVKHKICKILLSAHRQEAM